LPFALLCVGAGVSKLFLGSRRPGLIFPDRGHLQPRDDRARRSLGWRYLQPGHDDVERPDLQPGYDAYVYSGSNYGDSTSGGYSSGIGSDSGQPGSNSPGGDLSSDAFTNLTFDASGVGSPGGDGPDDGPLTWASFDGYTNGDGDNGNNGGYNSPPNDHHSVPEPTTLLLLAAAFLGLALNWGGDAADAAATARHTVEHHLTAHNLAGRFHEIVGHGDCESGKPAPDPFLKATECLGVELRLCLALEDSHNGVRSASSAGMMTVMMPDLLEPPAGRPRASRRALPQSARRGPSTRCGAP
jgi:hypothetical protein